MSSSLIETLQGLVTPALVKSIGGALGESDGAIASGLGAATSKILGGLIKNSGDAGVMDAVAQMVGAQARDPSGLNDLRGLLSGGIPASVAAMAGNQLLGAVIGDKLGALSQTVASAAGIKPESSASLFALAAPMVLGSLGQRLGGGVVPGWL